MVACASSLHDDWICSGYGIFLYDCFFCERPVFLDAANGEISWAWGMAPLLTFGFDAPLWVSLALADWTVKFSIALIALIPFRILTHRIFDQGK